MNDPVVISVLEPGMLTTVQDLGRSGQARFGVAPGGVLDRRAFVLGNRLLGNHSGDAGLEISLIGPRLVFSGTTVIAITGADLGARLNDSPMPRWEPIAVQAGDELSFNQANAGSGARAYLCIAGGFEVEPVLGSRSTDLIGLFGGHGGRALRRGDHLSVGSAQIDVQEVLRRRLSRIPEDPVADVTARVVLGPQRERFTSAGIETFLGCAFDISGKSNRQGIRLSGHGIEHVRGADMVSEGIAHGAVQVPGDGFPIVLLAGRQTVGGYVKIATVIGADLDALAQLRPGSHLRFEEVTLADAQVAAAAYRAEMAAVQITQTPALFGGSSSGKRMQTGEESELLHMAGGWDPAGVVRVIEAWERSSAASFKLEVAEFGLKLELHREGAPAGSGETIVQESSSGVVPVLGGEFTVTAPVLGVFFRRSSPDQPVLAESGSVVTAGQVICLLEVMKTYHEVVAPEGGTLIDFVVEDGAFVEYGQVIAHIKPLT